MSRSESSQKPAPPRVTQAVYRTVDETVYATGSVRLRSGPGTGYETVGYLEEDDPVHRIAVGDNGWSKLEVRSGTVFCSSKYLTLDAPGSGVHGSKPPTLQKVDENMVVSAELVLRSSPGTQYASLGTLKKGSLVHRIGIYSNGWSAIALGGRQVYVESASLEPEKLPGGPTLPEGYHPAEGTVTASENLNLRSGPGTEYEKVGRLPEGSSCRRIGLGDNGWSILIFEGKQVYAKSEYLLQIPSYRQVNETLWAKVQADYYTSPDSASNTFISPIEGSSFMR